MLTALEEGVKGGKWYCLMDKVKKRENLCASFAKVQAKRGAPGVDHVTVQMFEERLDENVARLVRELGDGTYAPRPVKRVYIPKPGTNQKRPLGIPTVRDRVVQGALRHVLEPIFERDFAEHSYGFRPGRGCKDALRRVEGLLDAGQCWVVDADIQGYFDAISHDRLVERIREKVTDRSVIGLVRKFLEQGILDGMRHWQPERGSPQGAVLSPLLSNIYLDPLDHLMAEQGFEMVRYADDFVVLCASEAEARRALEMIQAWTTEAELVLHPDKTRIVDASQRGGFDFLGYHFERGHKWPCRKSVKKLRDTIRLKTKRCNGHSLAVIIEDTNSTLRGWFEYFKHGHPSALRQIDGWVRMRLRSILRKRHKGKGRGRGADHHRWPNAYFAKHGLFSLVAARAEACQSARR
jgi:RNA-directed DNA polymerase